MISEIIRKHRWFLIALVVIYAAISLWLFFITDTPQTVPFEYEIR